MGVATSAMSRLGGSIAGAALAVTKIKEGFDEKEAKAEKAGIDQKMALKARRTAQQKINAINANKELSQKARTRRIGKVMDEYHKTLGGNK